MAYEDFTDDWTETDPDGELTVAAQKLEVNPMNYDGDCFFYKDGGANHFTDTLTHQFEITIDTIPSVNYVWAWGLGEQSTPAPTTTIVNLQFFDNDGLTMAIYAYKSGVMEDFDMTALETGTKYYITVTRNSGTLTAVIRTGSHSGAEVDTISCNDHQDSLRYLYLVNEDED